MGSSSSSARPQEKTPSVVLHRLHGENLQLSADWRSVTRLRGFEQAICFSNKPIPRNRYIDMRIKETNSSWRGVLRFGVTTIHPGTLKREHLPQCACPGLQERDGFWIDSIPETMAIKGSETYFYVTDDGYVMSGLTSRGKRQGFDEEVIINGVPQGKELWMVMELYGQTIQVELFEPGSSLTILQKKPDGLSSQKDHSAKLANRGREDPLIENTINLAIQKQKEQGQGASTDQDIIGANNAPSSSREEHPAPRQIEATTSVPAATRNHIQNHGPPNPPTTIPKPAEGIEKNETEISEEVKNGENNHEKDTEKQEATVEKEVTKSKECSVCIDADSDCALYKCGHVCMCYDCATLIMKGESPHCPVCREPIEDVIKTYQS